MDGIVSGLTSIVPILPDQTTIIDRSGMNGPPVEIMPLPTDSFMSDDAAAELLNNPYLLNLDKEKYGGGANTGGKNVGRKPPQAGFVDMGATLSEAYTLSLGNEENTPAGVETARELFRMRNYEQLGQMAARQVHRRNPETGAAEQAPASPREGGSTDQISEKVRSLLSQPLILNSEEGIQSAEYLLPPETMPEEAFNTPQAPQPAGDPAAAGVRKNLMLLSSLAGLQLSASDIEVVLALEPELQEALLNMLSSINTGSSGSDTPQTLPFGARPEGTALQAPAQAPDVPGPDAPASITMGMPAEAVLTQSQLGTVRRALEEISRQLDPSAMRQLADLPDNARAILLSDEELTRLAAEIYAAGKNASQAGTMRGDIANLRKITELPYSLYVFGHLNAERKDTADEDIEADIYEQQDARGMKTGDYLRISEAIKMASVLHNLYYGGSGRFPEETPWYTPYVRYAIKNGIINNDEFANYNEYATRAETAYIFSNCVPKAEFPILNYVSDIPDVLETLAYGASVYLLYRAGVLKKNGGNANFYPERMITKSEAAIIIGRIATPEDRKLGYTAR